MALVLVLLLLGAEPWPEQGLEKGLAALKAGRVAEARAALEEAAKLTPGEPVVWLALADARLRSGEAALAVAAMQQARKLAAGSPLVERARGMFARRMGEAGKALLDARQEKRAETLLRAALLEFPKEAELWRLLGLALYAQGRNPAAVTAFMAAIDLAPEDETLYAGLETLLPAGKAVETRLAQYAAAHAESALGWYLLGLERGDAALWEKALALDGKFWPAAFALHRQAEPARAVALLERVVELNAEYAPAYYSLAQLYGRLGEREKALAARRRHHELVREAP
ncbi:MAG: tetratricopeptide repeat protein [Bryobacteraceae bacterium]|nr:tetratricopeptide repeat protein [Bryobacteraceae bacterium]